MGDDLLNICFVTDDKPGHRHQLEGLQQALTSRVDLRAEWVHTSGPLHNVRLALTAQAEPPPHLIIACGHRTHLVALALKRRFRARLVVLMRPSLPLRWFDLCVLPEHDRAPQADNILRTRGVLNKVTPAQAGDPNQGLILLGGPSRHHNWNTASMVTQLLRLKAALPAVQWMLTSSRRTPADCATALAPLLDAGFIFIPAAQTPGGWLEEQLHQRGRVWVSEDSVSMVYESLSAGAQVGLLEVPRQGPSRVAAGVDRLLAEQRLSTLDHLVEQGDMLPAREPLQEAERVAKYIIKHQGRLA